MVIAVGVVVAIVVVVMCRGREVLTMDSVRKKIGDWKRRSDGVLYVCMLCYDFGLTGGMGLLSMLLSFTH